MSDFNIKPVGKDGRELNGPRLIAHGEVTVDATDIDIPIVGLLATDIVTVSLHTQAGTADIADLIAVCEADNLNIQVSEKGDDTGIVAYQISRS